VVSKPFSVFGWLFLSDMSRLRSVEGEETQTLAISNSPLFRGKIYLVLQSQTVVPSLRASLLGNLISIVCVLPPKSFSFRGGFDSRARISRLETVSFLFLVCLGQLFSLSWNRGTGSGEKRKWKIGITNHECKGRKPHQRIGMDLDRTARWLGELYTGES
jgi:hypothetical protein